MARLIFHMVVSFEVDRRPRLTPPPLILRQAGPSNARHGLRGKIHVANILMVIDRAGAEQAGKQQRCQRVVRACDSLLER